MTRVPGNRAWPRCGSARPGLRISSCMLVSPTPAAAAGWSSSATSKSRAESSFPRATCRRRRPLVPRSGSPRHSREYGCLGHLARSARSRLTVECVGEGRPPERMRTASYQSPPSAVGAEDPVCQLAHLHRLVDGARRSSPSSCSAWSGGRGLQATRRPTARPTSCASRAPASSPPRTPSGGGSSATCTTARSSTSSRSQ